MGLEVRSKVRLLNAGSAPTTAIGGRPHLGIAEWNRRRYRYQVSRAEKRLRAIRDNPNDVRFDDLCTCAESMGFVVAKGGGGSHRVYRHPGPPAAEMVVFQERADGKAKAYQVKQFLEALERLFPEVEP